MIKKPIPSTPRRNRCLLLAILVFAWGSTKLCGKEVAETGAESRELRVRTTAYTHSERDHLKYGRKTAAGTTLVSGRVNSAAADWSFLPLGTVFRINGDPTIYKVEDYGSALVGTRTVDIYRPCVRTMNRWGVRHVDIEILEPGCRARSIQLLRVRTRYPHCRRMLNALMDQDPGC